MSSIFCDDVIKLYMDPQADIQVPALRGIELTIESGSLVAVIGPSGAGKTTLINVIGGLDAPTSGSVLIGDTRVERLRGRELDRFRREKVGFLSQSPHQNLLWNLTVKSNVLFPMRISGKWSRKDREDRAQDLLERVGLIDRAKSRPQQLSGGEAQRAGLAVSLANDPDVLLADEPTGELDSATTFRIIDYLRELNRDLKKTIVVVTHDTRFANMSDFAYRIRDGRISGLHRAKAEVGKAPSEREELVYVDSHGNLRLPEEVREKVGIKTYARVVARDDHARVYPAEE